MKEVFTNPLFYMVIIALIIVMTIIIHNKKQQKKQIQREAKTMAMMDQMSMRRAAINTKYMEKDFFRDIQNLVYSFYAQAPQSIPNENILPELYMEWYEKIKREYELGIQRQVNRFKMKDAKVIKQDNSSMYAVTRIEVRAGFEIEYHYSHATMEKRAVRSFTQEFVFLNMHNAWVLEQARKEDDVKEEVIVSS